jgi:hypothetical protein
LGGGSGDERNRKREGKAIKRGRARGLRRGRSTARPAREAAREEWTHHAAGRSSQGTSRGIHSGAGPTFPSGGETEGPGSGAREGLSVSSSVSFPRDDGGGESGGRRTGLVQAMGWAPPAVGAVVVVGEMPHGRSPPEGGEARGRGGKERSKRDGRAGARVVVVVVGICGGGERARALWGEHSAGIEG